MALWNSPLPSSLEHIQLAAAAAWLVFMFAFGACAGSLINVLVYRLPLGLGVVTQGSRCPACGTPLTWRENIPVLGWLLLRGKCRFCKTPISPEYPLVEAFVGLLFAGTFALWYLVPESAHWMGVNWGAVAPEWARADVWERFPRSTWAPFVALIILLASLTAMTLVDAKTFTIPLQIPWFATIVGIVLHTAGAAIVGPLRSAAPHTGWALPTPGGSLPQSAGGWTEIGVAIGGMVGLGVGVLLLHFGLIRRSFADYQEWEDRARAEMAAKSASATPPPAEAPQQWGGESRESDSVAAPPPSHPGLANAAVDPSHQAAGPVGEAAAAGARQFARGVLITLALALGVGGVVTLLSGPLGLPPWSGLVAGVVLAPMGAAVLARRAALRAVGGVASPLPAAEPPAEASSPDMWIAYPHARREMVKELLFLTPCAGLAWLGGWIAAQQAGTLPPFWLVVLAASLMGYLIGGGIVWLVRIAGSLAFGKEAMGLGDVHLMAAVGACVGWIDAALAFPLAAFVGLYWVVVSRLASGETAKAMPFGPYLAIATAVVIFAKPLVEMGLTAVLGIPPSERPINLP